MIVAGPPEIDFARLSGVPSDFGTITLTYGGKSKNIIINQIGMVDY